METIVALELVREQKRANLRAARQARAMIVGQSKKPQPPSAHAAEPISSMNTHIDNSSPSAEVKEKLVIKVFGVGGAGGNAVAQMVRGDFADVSFHVFNTDAQALAQITGVPRFQLGAKITRGLGAGGDPEIGRTVAEADAGQLRALCEDADIVFLTAGLGGGTGTGASPVIAQIARDAGALVLAFVTLPFDWEGALRQRQAQKGLEQLKAAADGVICLPNQKVFKLFSDNTSFVEMFALANELFAQGVHGIWRLLARTGLINIDFADLCAVVRGRHAESAFATADAAGPNRAREAVDKLLASPLLDGGMLADADAVLVSLMGGPDLTMAEVNRVMEQINRQCENAHVIMGATIDAAFGDRLSVTLVASRRGHASRLHTPLKPGAVSEADADDLPEFDTNFIRRQETARPSPRFVPPPPAPTTEQAAELFEKKASSSKPTKRKREMMQQTELKFQIISKGRFEKSAPTLHNGEDLDVPTFVRRGVALN